jgi:hypothetical protein
VFIFVGGSITSRVALVFMIVAYFTVSSNLTLEAAWNTMDTFFPASGGQLVTDQALVPYSHLIWVLVSSDSLDIYVSTYQTTAGNGNKNLL